jgi:regulator of sigma D
MHPATGTPPAGNTIAPGTRNSYDPLLIKRFRSDHQRMLGLFTEAQALLGARDYEGLKYKLGELHGVLQDHLMTASVKLYVYLSRHLTGDAAKSALINQHRREMLENSRLILGFLRTYGAAHLDDSNADLFQAEFLAIGAALAQRIEREDNVIYPLYRASY